MCSDQCLDVCVRKDLCVFVSVCVRICVCLMMSFPIDLQPISGDLLCC